MNISRTEARIGGLLRGLRWVLMAGFAIAAAVTVEFISRTIETAPPFQVMDQESALTIDNINHFMSDIRAALKQPTAEAKAALAKHASLLAMPLHIDLWRDGVHLGETMHFGLGDAEASASALIDNAKGLRPADAPPIDENSTLVLSLFYQPERFDSLQQATALSISRFLPSTRYGAYIGCRGSEALLPPIRIASRGFASRGFASGSQAVTTYLDWLGCSDIRYVQMDLARIDRFAVSEWVQPNAYSQPVRWYGADRLLPEDALSKAFILRHLRAQQAFLATHQKPDGALPYLYFPLYDEESKNNQLIRQWFAAFGLLTLHHHVPGDASLSRVQALADQLLRDFYKQDEAAGKPRGYFLLNGYAQLSANSTAALSLRRLAAMEPRYLPPYLRVIDTIRQQRDEQGAFNTRIVVPADAPAAASDTQFAPGIALMALAEAVQYEHLPLSVFDELLVSFRHYYALWQANPSLYASQWHLNGYGALAQAMAAKGLAVPDDLHQAIFAIADHLLTCQQTDDVPPQTKGAFNQPHCVDASSRPVSSGVRSEGLIRAALIAHSLRDEARSERYQAAVKLAMRHLLHGIIDEQNQFYFKNPAKALGGMRDALEQPHIRIDMPGHSLMALDALLQSGLLKE